MNLTKTIAHHRAGFNNAYVAINTINFTPLKETKRLYRTFNTPDYLFPIGIDSSVVAPEEAHLERLEETQPQF